MKVFHFEPRVRLSRSASTDLSRRASAWPIALVACGAIALGACNSQQQGPVLASSAGEANYAESYPQTVASSRATVSDADAEVTRVGAEMAKYPDDLKDPDYHVVLDVVESSDAAGKSSSYATQAEESRQVKRFLTEEKEKLSQQVSGSVRYTLKEKGASEDAVDAGGSAAVFGMQKAVDKQLEERLRRANPAHRIIDENEESLGKANVDALRKQADDIARASHLLHVVLPEEKQRLEALIGEASDVKGTLEKTIEEERAVAADAKTSSKRKAVAEKRVASAEAALSQVDQEAEQAKQAHKSLETRIAELQKSYDQALSDLKKQLEERAAAQPEKPAA